jgi:hypothetical protein
MKGRDGHHPIPAAALDERFGFIGTSGSGETRKARRPSPAITVTGSER